MKQPKEIVLKPNGIVEQTESTPSHLIELAITQKASVEQLEKLMDLQMRWEANQARKKFFESLSAFQNDMPVVTKNKAVKFNQTAYNYATLDNIINEIKQHLNKHGLAYRWEFEDTDKIIVKCIITHISGHSETTTMSSSTDKSGSKNDIQSRGSALTYLQRYTLIGALGIGTAQDDTDAVSVQPTLAQFDSAKYESEMNAINDYDSLVQYCKKNTHVNKHPEFVKLFKNRDAKIKEGVAL